MAQEKRKCIVLRLEHELARAIQLEADRAKITRHEWMVRTLALGLPKKGHA